MTQQLVATQTRAGAFDTVAQADRAIRGGCWPPVFPGTNWR